MGAPLEIAGQKFGRLTALSSTGLNNSEYRRLWKFRCDCGSEVVKEAKSVKGGNTKSCGCLRADQHQAWVKSRQVEKVCPVCKTQFVRKLSHKDKTTYCSASCLAKDYRKRMQGTNNPNYRDGISSNPEMARRYYSQRYKNANLELFKEKTRIRNRQTKAIRKSLVGSYTQDDVDGLLGRQAGLCAACRCCLFKNDTHEDHIIAVKNGGTNFIGNIQLLCAQCNLRKKTMTPVAHRYYSLLRESEDIEQATLMRWVTLEAEKRPDLGFLYHTGNGGYRAKTTAIKMMLLGVRRGVPDLNLPIARGGFFGLFIELKVGKNQPTPEQRAWIAALRAEGHRVDVCHGWEKARDTLLEYISQPRTQIRLAA